MENHEILNTFIEEYRNYVETNYDYVLEHKLEAFPFLKFSDYLNITNLKVSTDIFNYPNYYVIVDNYPELQNEYDFQSFNDEEKRKIMDETSKSNRHKKLVEVMLPEIPLKNVTTILGTGVSGNLNSQRIKSQVALQADKDYRTWNTENKTPVKRYDHNKISPHSHLDYEGLINRFNDKEYNQDFKYQMEQAEECYKRKLYLPAAATLSVALETTLLALCKKHDIKVKNETMLNFLGQRLLEEEIINYRLEKRIDITYSLRNSLAHSNKGEVSKADCEIILNCIRVVLDEHY